MQIRIEGEESEMDSAVECIRQVFPVKSVSGFYRNRKKVGISE